MDSLSQIVLGAAVGEICLGKKLGNRAMVWGAIGGTIPDLDVFAEYFMNEIDALAFHRSLTHSITFSVIAPLLMAWITHLIYSKGWYKNIGIRFSFYGLSLLLISSALFSANFIVHVFAGATSLVLAGLSVMTIFWFIYRWYQRYILNGHDIALPNYKEWYLMFFWAFFTHILLDSFTAFGTQVFWPFSNWRVAFNSIAIVDPLYTLPFLLCIVLASAFYRKENRRFLFNFAGIAISSFYILLTLYNHFQVKSIFIESLHKENIEYDRIMVSPTILSNALWNGVAQNAEDQYYYGRYSIFDKEKKVQHFKRIDGQHHLMEEYQNFEAFNTLNWFCNGYYCLEEKDSILVMNDLRYGTFNDEYEPESKFVFRFNLKPNGKDFDVDIKKGSREEGTEATIEKFKALWARMNGK